MGTILQEAMNPIELDYDTSVEISIWVENYLGKSITGQDYDNKVRYWIESIKKFKDLLLIDKKYSIKVIDTFYNPLINEICYELENGIIFTNNKKYDNQISSDYRINLFYSIVDPGNPKLRILKIQKLINGK